MKQSVAGNLLRTQLLPWAVSSAWGLVCFFVTCFVAFESLVLLHGGGLAVSFGVIEAARLIALLSLGVATVTTVGQSAALIIVYLVWPDLSRWRLAAWSAVAAVGAVCVAPFLWPGENTLPMLDRPYLSVVATAGVSFVLTVGVGWLLAQPERRRQNSDLEPATAAKRAPAER